MADLLPSSPDPAAGDGGEPKVIGVDSEDADDLLAALQSETARDVLATLYDDPATPSALAEEVDTSIQNVRYHLDRLTDADLVEVADTIYSEKGREMKVYAPAAKPLVVFAGNDDETPGIEAALSRLLGGLGILGLSSLAVQRFFGGRGVVPNLDYQLGGGSDAAQVTTESENATWSGQSGTMTESDGSEATTAQEAQETASGTATETATDSGGGGGGANGDGGGGGVNGGDDGTTAEEATETTRTVAETTQTAGDSAGTVTEEATTVTESATTVTDSAATVTDSGTTVTESPETVTESARTATESAGTATETAAQSTTTVVEAAGSAMGGLPPGLVFFAGGLAVLLALGAAWYLRAR